MPERAGSEDDDRRLHAPRDAGIRGILHDHLPHGGAMLCMGAVLDLGDRKDFGFGEHGRAVIDRVGDVGDADGVLGADVAPRPAIAAVPAGVLHHAGRVQPRLVRDRHRRQLRGNARRFGCFAHAGVLREAVGLGDGRNAEHGLGA